MLYGAIAGDIAGSLYEYVGIKGDEDLFSPESTFTDDTILTLAVADALMSQMDVADALRLYATLYPQPMGGYGDMFVDWLGTKKSQARPYNSCGNGSAMRVSACGWIADSIEETQSLARLSAECTHNHPEGIKGAEATAACIFLARNGSSKDDIREYINSHYYDMSRSFEDIYNEPYRFGAMCQDTVPNAIQSFLYSTDFESSLRFSMLTNKDTDTAAAITGAIAEAFYGVPEYIKDIVREKLDEHLLDVLDSFNNQFEH